MAAELKQAIIQEIRNAQAGRIPFRRYMELALYHPRWGYYTGNRKKLGPEGDFYTSPFVGEVFGRTWGRFLRRFWGQAPFVLVEAGAGDGRLTEQILREWIREGLSPKEVVSYLLDVSPDHRAQQQQRLHEFCGIVHWVDSWDQIPPGGCTCIISNELLDAFPFHRVRRRKGCFQEIYVTLTPDQEGFAEIEGPLSTPELARYIKEMDVHLTEGQETEINLEAKQWVRDATEWWEQGLLITVDYGGLSHELTAPHRLQGTWRCYENHRLHTDVYQNPGEADITADVNFTALERWGHQLGLRRWVYQSQSRFLQEAGILDWVQPVTSADPFHPDHKRNRAIRQLIAPGGMGDAFQVMIQTKGLSLPPWP
jgi:SAM-dependent MidA family methyltransferase